MTDDIVTRLRHKYAGQLPICADAADEIERLRTALCLAVGQLSTYDNHRLTPPDLLYHHFLEEARRG